jgi:hypothetical protein
MASEGEANGEADTVLAISTDLVTLSVLENEAVIASAAVRELTKSVSVTADVTELEDPDVLEDDGVIVGDIVAAELLSCDVPDDEGVTRVLVMTNDGVGFNHLDIEWVIVDSFVGEPARLGVIVRDGVSVGEGVIELLGRGVSEAVGVAD